jgi:tripartite-type tricarboxylate transporter receptor subunit TctC
VNPTNCSSLVALAAALYIVAPSHAQYPAKPLRLVVPFAAGSANDTVGRIIAPSLSAALGRPVVIDNRPGAAGNIGAEVVAKSPADGYTLMMGNISHAISMTFHDKPGYDLLRDFVPVTQLASGSFLLAVHPSLPVKSVKELIAFARARPGQVNVGTSGAGIFLASELFQSMSATRMLNVTYRSTPQAVTAVVSGEVSVGFPATSSALPQAKAGRLRALAVTGARRISMAAELPTVSEAGLSGYEASPWYGLLVPAGTPQDIVSRLHADSVKVVAQPDVRERFGAADLEAAGTTPQQFATYMQNEIAKWGKIVKATGMRPE